MIITIIAAVFIVGGVGFYLYRSGYRLQKVTDDNVGPEESEFDNNPEITPELFESISHELRTPLTLISGQVNEINHKCFDSDVPGLKEDVDGINHLVRTLEYHVESLLEAVEIEAGQHTHFDKTRYDIAAQLIELADFLHTNVSTQGDTLSKHFPSEKVELLADKRKVDQTIIAVVAEGLLKLEVGATVTLFLEIEENPKGDACTISIQFNGDAIAPENREERLHHMSSLLRSFNTYGKAGFVKAQHWIHAQGGTFSLNEISEFEFTYQISFPDVTVESVPKKEPVGDYTEEGETKSEPGSDVHQPNIRSDKQTILIVEDDRAIQRYLATLLKRDYNIIKANDGLKGLKAAQKLLPDLIISDVVMPNMDGLEFCEAVRKDSKISYLPFIMLTSKVGEKDRFKGLKFGADSYIRKPFSAEILRETVKNHLASQKRLLKKLEVDRGGEYSLPVSKRDDFLEELDRAINRNIEDYDLSIEQLAKELNVSQRQMQRKVKSLSGLTPKKYLRHRRLKAAEYLLKNGSGSVTEVAYTVGFNNLSLFSSYFKEEFGKLPSTLKSAN